ncbi:MAG: DUF3267 domain-containing protein [Chlorobi bacterium]|nr:DUF3267 domain-containing protein [Chlorobiota bacterium]
MSRKVIKDSEQIRNNPQFKLAYKLVFREIPEFVLHQAGRRNPVTFVYYIILLALLTAVIVYPFSCIHDIYPAGQWFRYAALGFVVFPVLSIPVHEGIHGLVYLLAGAPRIRIGADWKLFFFYIAADRFPVDVKWFRRIAFAPALILSVILLGIPLLPGIDSLLIWSMLITGFVHFTMCIGDFAMAGFLYEFHDPDMVTFDDLSEKAAYFYSSNPSNIPE